MTEQQNKDQSRYAQPQPAGETLTHATTTEAIQ